MDNEFLLVVYNLGAPCSSAKMTKKSQMGNHVIPPQYIQIIFLFEPSDVIKKWYWYGVFLPFKFKFGSPSQMYPYVFRCVSSLIQCVRQTGSKLKTHIILCAFCVFLSACHSLHDIQASCNLILTDTLHQTKQLEVYFV